MKYGKARIGRTASAKLLGMPTLHVIFMRGDPSRSTVNTRCGVRVKEIVQGYADPALLCHLCKRFYKPIQAELNLIGGSTS